MSRKNFFLIILILIFGFIVRLYQFSAPISDWHAWRQVDTSAVSKFFVKDGFDILHPKFYDLSNVPSGVHANPQGYRFVEFPIYNIFQASLSKFIGVMTIEEWGRIVTIFSSLLSSWLIFLIVRKYSSDISAILAMFFFTFIPFNIFYGRTILPDTMTVTSFLAAIFFFSKWVDENLTINFNFFLVIFLMALSFLLKPFAIFFMLPMIYLAFDKYGLNLIKKKQLWILGIISLLPFLFWRIWMLQFPGGIPQSGWLFNGSEIRFKGAFFHWIFAQRIGGLILGYWGLPILIIGILLKLPRKSYFFFLSFLISSILYVVVVATGNVQHDYYQILIIPSISIFLGLGGYYLWTNKSGVYKIIPYSILVVCTLFMLSFGWFSIRDYYNINRPELIVIGKEVDRLTPKDAKIIVPTEIGDTTALYFMNRQGWSSFEKPLPELIKMGADYMVIINPKEQDYDFQKKYKLVTSSPDFILFNLRQNP